MCRNYERQCTQIRDKVSSELGGKGRGVGGNVGLGIGRVFCEWVIFLLNIDVAQCTYVVRIKNIENLDTKFRRHQGPDTQNYHRSP